MSLDITQKSTEKRTASRIYEDDVVKKAHNFTTSAFHRTILRLEILFDSVFRILLGQHYQAFSFFTNIFTRENGSKHIFINLAKEFLSST